MRLFHGIKQHHFLLKIIACCVMINFLISSIFFAFFIHAQHKTQRDIVTVDIIKIMEDYSALVAHTLHSPEAIKRNAKYFSERLEQVLSVNANEKKLVIMPKQAVIQGAQDITPQIEQLVFRKQDREL